MRITSPANGSFAYASGAALAITADATDLDGTITNVQFFAGTNKVGEISASPWTRALEQHSPRVLCPDCGGRRQHGRDDALRSGFGQRHDSTSGPGAKHRSGGTVK